MTIITGVLGIALKGTVTILLSTASNAILKDGMKDVEHLIKTLNRR